MIVNPGLIRFRNSLNKLVSFDLPLNDLGSGAVNTTPRKALGSATPTFTRATTAYAWTSSGVMVSVASGTARSQYTPTGIYLGYLAETVATQLVTPTAAIKDMTVAWSKGATLTIAKTATDTLGNANACSVLTGGAVAATNTATLTLVAAATSRTYSCYIKRVTGTGPILITQDNFATSTDVSSQLTANTWVLVQLNQSQLNAVYGLQVSTNGDVIHVDWNQFEAGGLATSPIDTSGGTRNADVLTYVSATNVSATEDTIYAEAYAPIIIAGSFPTVISCNSGATANQFSIYLTTKTSTRAQCKSAGVAQSDILSTISSVDTRKSAASFEANNFQLASNGIASAGDVAGSMPVGITKVTIGADGASLLQLNGCIKNVLIYTTNLPIPTLQVMTL
jgi:hypothetical protein